jgi:hypothetical protein
MEQRCVVHEQLVTIYKSALSKIVISSAISYSVYLKLQVILVF